MSGKSRYGSGFGSGHYASDTSAERIGSVAAITAAMVATDAAVQASWSLRQENLFN